MELRSSRDPMDTASRYEPRFFRVSSRDIPVPGLEEVGFLLGAPEDPFIPEEPLRWVEPF